MQAPRLLLHNRSGYLIQSYTSKIEFSVEI